MKDRCLQSLQLFEDQSINDVLATVTVIWLQGKYENKFEKCLLITKYKTSQSK